MNTGQNRHDLTTVQWDRIEPPIKGRLGKWGGSNANDNRIFVNGVFGVIRTGAPWRDLREHNEQIYGYRYRIENTFLGPKKWRGVAT